MTDKELEQIYNEAYKAVYWTAMALLKNEADAEDIVQDTFVSLIESYDSIEDKSKVVAWLKKNAANKCLNRLTRTKTDNVEDEFFDSVEAVPEDFLPDSIVESEDTRKIIMDIINNVLSDDVRRTLILFYFDEMSTKEIAEALKIPQGTVLWRLNFAKKKIKKEVEKYEEENDTKLYGMAIPFLTKLFAKEAEKVAFKPLPASLSNLSASTEASKAGTNLAKTAVKKGTDIMKTKILIGSVAGVVAVGATIGIIIGVLTKKDDKKPSGPRDTKIEETERSVNHSDEDIVITDTEPEESEETKTSQKITEDSIYIGMDGMSAEEIVDNVWKTTRVKVGMTKEEYAERFVLTGDQSKAKSVVDSYYWQFVLIPYADSCFIVLDVSVPYDKDTSAVTEIGQYTTVEAQMMFNDPEFSEEVFERFIERYKAEGYEVYSDYGPSDKLHVRVIEFRGNGRKVKISLQTGDKATLVVRIPILNE